MFSTLKYVNAPNFEKFRDNWNAKYLGGFVVHSKAFDGLKGNFPIGFLIWKTATIEFYVKPSSKHEASLKQNPIIEILTEVLDKNANPIGEKTFYNIPNKQLLT
ncbi:MAG: hypothetical protein V9E96_13780 [Chitinophagaceae bacterium]